MFISLISHLWCRTTFFLVNRVEHQKLNQTTPHRVFPVRLGGTPFNHRWLISQINTYFEPRVFIINIIPSWSYFVLIYLALYQLLYGNIIQNIGNEYNCIPIAMLTHIDFIYILREIRTHGVSHLWLSCFIDQVISLF